MMKLILSSCMLLSLAASMHADPVKKLQILIDSQPISFDSAPILKNKDWLVPVDPLCKQLGLKVEYPDGAEMVVICGGGESELCVPLQFDKGVFNIDKVAYAKLESIAEPFGFAIHKVSDTQFEIIRPEQFPPQFTLPDLDDTPRRLQDFRGKKTLLYIWGSW